MDISARYISLSWGRGKGEGGQSSPANLVQEFTAQIFREILYRTDQK